MKKDWTGERLESFIYSRDAVEHLHRYALVAAYVEGKEVLDIACGEGYGSNLMSTTAKFVKGVDIDAQTVAAAKVKYAKSNLHFQTGSATQIPLDDQSIDVVVSFETIEHHGQHEEMITEIKRVLRPNGIMIISTPDKLYYSDKRNFNNKFHVKELYKQEFVDLIAPKFTKLQLLAQTYCNGNSIIQDEKNQADLQFYTGDYSQVATEAIDPFYLIIIASDGNFTPQKLSVFDGGQIVKKDMLDQLHRSNTFKVGHFILSPFKFLKKKSKGQ